MLSSIVHQPCELSLHLYSPDVFIHPPRPGSDAPSHDKTLTGLVEIKSPSDRTIQGIKVTLQGLQTLTIPEIIGQTGVMGTRSEEKVVLSKTVEISAETVQAVGKGKNREVESDQQGLEVKTVEEPGIHLNKGVHGFEFAFIIPSSSAPIERTKNGRLRYNLTATALGGGRGRVPVSVTRDIFIVLQVNADGGPTPLDIQFHDIHEALGALSVSLTSASLTVGGTASLSIYHPTIPPGLSVHVARVFLEQTVELFSDLRKGWMKLPIEKLRLWERGYMPYKDKAKQVDPNLTIEDSLWLRADDGISPGRPGRGASNAPTLSPYGTAIHGSGGPPTPAYGGNSPLVPLASLPGNSHPSTVASHGGTSTPSHEGYRIKSVMRMPDDNTIRPSTVRGSRAEIRISHEIGVEIFFSRASVLDDRPTSDSFGKPKVQVFSMRRATIIPSCLATFDTIHLPPYTFESPINSRPTSPAPFAPSSLGSNFSGRGRELGGLHSSPDDLEYFKLTQSLRAALPHASGTTSPANELHSAERSQPASRNTSPTRSHGLGLFGRKSRNTSPSGHGRKSRPASPNGTSPGNHTSSIAIGTTIGGTSGTSSGSTSSHSISTNRKGVPSLHALTPAHPLQTNAYPTVVTAPASGTTTPKSLPANSPWAITNLPPRTSTSHSTCQCGRSTEELIEAERRLLEGAATAPGIFSDAHDEGQLPPPWTASRPSSPTDEEVTGWISQNAASHTNGEHIRSRAKVGETFPF